MDDTETKKKSEELGWVKPVLGGFTILFAIMLFALIGLAFIFRQEFEITWGIIVVSWTLFAFLRFPEIGEFGVGLRGLWAKKAKLEEVLSPDEKQLMIKERRHAAQGVKGHIGGEVIEKVGIVNSSTSPTVTLRAGGEASTVKGLRAALAMRELEHLLSDYSFFYGHWDQEGKSEVIRFSDAFSGRPLRYINHFAADINEYLFRYSRNLKQPLKDSIYILKNYVDYVTIFQKEGENLFERAFIRQEYLRLIKNIVDNFKQENFQDNIL